MRRREFITLLGGAAATWPLAAPGNRASACAASACLSTWPLMIRKGMLVLPRSHRCCRKQVDYGPQHADDYRWWRSTDAMAKYAEELVALAPDVILAATSSSVAALQRIAGTIPIVFVQVIDPVSNGFVASLARPGGNATGFTIIEYGFSGKWLELLKEIASRITRTAVIRDPTSAFQMGQMGAIQSVAPSLGVELRPVEARDAGEIERAVTAFARSGHGGLIVLSGNASLAHRELIIALAARERLPAVYADRVFVAGGGLMSYDTNRTEQYRRAAGYVDRILKGEKPADLPVQAPTKYDLVINLKTAKALGLDIPATLLARRRGDRITGCLAAARNVGYWHLSAVRGTASSGSCWRESGHVADIAETTRMTQLRHPGGYKPVVKSGSAYLAAL